MLDPPLPILQPTQTRRLRGRFGLVEDELLEKTALDVIALSWMMKG